MKRIIRTVFCLTLVLLVCGVTGCTKAARATRAIAKADSDVEKGRYEDAEIRYRDALSVGRADPGIRAKVLPKLGRVYFAQGRWFPAAGCLAQGIAGNTNDLASRMLYGESLFFMGSLPTAFSEFEAVLQARHVYPEAMVMLVDSARDNVTNLTKAASILNGQPENAKKTAAYRTAQGSLLLYSGSLDSNKVLIVETEYQAALEFDKNFYRAHLGMAHVYSWRKEPTKAVAEAQAALLSLPNRSGAISVCLETLYALGERNEATTLATDMTRNSPDFIPPYLFLASKAFGEGKALRQDDPLKQKRYNESLLVLKNALVKDQQNLDALVLSGDVCLAKNDGTNALRCFQQAANSVGGAPPSLQLKMGYAHLANRDLPSAKASFDVALKTDTNSVYAEAALALANLAITEQDLRSARDLTPTLYKLIEEQPKKWGGYKVLADLYLTLKENDKAIEVMLSAQKQFTNAEVPYLLGTIYRNSGQKTQARKAFELALELDSNNLSYLDALIAHDLNNDKYEEAYKLISSRVNQHPDSASLLFRQGTVLRVGAQKSVDKAVQEERNRLAITSFEKAIKYAPDFSQAYFALTEVYVETAQEPKALGVLQDYLSQSETNHSPNSTFAPQILDQRVKAHLLAVKIHKQRNEYPEAAEHNGRAVQEIEDYLNQTKTNSPTDQVLAPRILAQRAGVHFVTAQIYEQLKQYSKAAEHYEEILAMKLPDRDPTFAALNNLACLYADHTTNKWKEAYTLAQRARTMNPGDASIIDTLGWAALKAGDYSQALTLLREAEADPRLAGKLEVRYHFAVANYMVGNEAIARETFQKALEALAAEEAKNAKTGSSTNAALEPSPAWVEDAKTKLSNLKLDVSAADPGLEEKLKEQLKATPSDPVLLRRLGKVQERRGDYRAALESYETALKSNPKHSGIRLQIALLRAGPMKELARGLDLAKKVKSDSPNDPEAIRVVGKLAYQSGEYSLAKGLLEESVRNYPEDISLRYEFGAALYSVGRVADAEQEMRKVVASSADVPQVAEAKQFLAFVAATKEPGKHPEAVQAAIAALAKATNNLPALMVVAVEAETRKEYEKAVGFYTRILKDYPPFSPATRSLGLLYFSNAQDRAKAYDLLYKVRDQYSEDLVFGRALGILACQRENYHLAALLLKPVAEGRSDDLEALFYLGKAQLNTKRTVEARQTLGRAMQLGLPEELKKEARTMLEGLK